MKLIAYVSFKSTNVETPFSNHFNVSGDGQKHSTLHLIKLSAAEHTAVYYCAARAAQCSKPQQWGYKNVPYSQTVCT